MQPLNPEVHDSILARRPDADQADIEEYERLLSARFAVDPDSPPSAEPEALMGMERESLENRLVELYNKLFREAPINQ